MSSKIYTKRTSIAGKVPTTSNIDTGELALNLRDGRLYSSNGTNVFEVGANVHSLSVGAGGFSIGNGAITFPTSDGTANQFLQTDGSGNVTFQSATVSDISDLTATATELNYLDGVTGITLGSANELLVVGGDGSSIVSDSTLAVDISNNRLGINQSSPEVTLHMTGEGAQTAQIRMEQYNDSADAPDIRTRRYRGTIASPSAIQSGDYLFRSNHEFYNGSALIVGGQFAFDNTNNANRTQFTIAVTTDGTSVEASSNDDVQFKIDGNDSGAITFNNAYKFPTSDGSSGQVLVTNGTGTLTFQNQSGSGSANNIVFYSANNTLRLYRTDGLELDTIINVSGGGEVSNAYLTSTFVTNTTFQSTLANTNLAISDRIQVANATLLINDRLQVANAAATYQTIAIERAALANTNSAIADRLQVANAVSTYQTIAVERLALANTNLAIADRIQVANLNSTLSNYWPSSNVITYVGVEIAALVNSAPSTLDTLNELAAALGDDPNFATTLTTNLGQKLGSTATVTLTGDITAGPTAFSSNAVTLTTVDTNLGNTNLAIADRLQVANAVATYQTIAVERLALANTNLAIADRLQVANAASTYQTIAIERAALANTNLAIADRLQVANAITTLAGLTDVAQVTPTDGHVLTYSSSNTTYYFAEAAGGSSTLAELTDVAQVTPSDGQVLKYSTSNTTYYFADGTITSSSFQATTANGTQTTFTSPISTSDPKDVLVTIDGVLQIPTTDYSISGTTVTISPAPLNDSVVVVRTGGIPVATQLQDLSDIAQVTPTDGHVLKYSSANSTYYFAAESGAAGGVSNAYLTSTFTTNTDFQSYVSNTNPRITSLEARPYITTANDETIATASQTVVDSFSATAFRSAKYIVQVTHDDDNNRFQTSEVLLVHNGSAAFLTEYGSVATAGPIASIDADVSGGNVRLLVTPSYNNSTIETVRITVSA
jgi:hypothetical protein